ncbi:MAG TPA: hypothetical protein VLH35_05720 [Candidatus Acidoferrales bacterium]|nr:hypothetical protein [Candidatus Acidoferrales bacterium]
MNNSVKAIIALLTIVIALSFLTLYQSPQTLTVDGTSVASVSEASTVWAKTYGGSADDRAFYALSIGDDSLIVGSTKSAGNTTMGWLLMLDAQGKILWNQTYLYGTGTELRYAAALSDGYLLVGNQFSSNDINGYVAKVDTAGALVWQTVVGGEKIDKLFSGATVSDGFIVCGLSYSYGGSGEAAWALKLDTNGETVWNNIYVCGANCALRSIVASDGGVVAAGYSDTQFGNYDFTLLKIASDGHLSWNKTYGDQNSEKAYSITSAPDGYVLVGDVTSIETNADAWVVRVDSDGILLWSRTIGGADFDSATYVTATSNDQYLVTGFTFSFGEGNRDFWLFNINDDGQVGFCYTYGDSAFQEAYSVVESGNSQYTLFGWTDPLGQSDLVGKATYDFYVVKLSAPEGAGFSILSIGGYVAILVMLILVLLLFFRMRKKQK